MIFIFIKLKVVFVHGCSLLTISGVEATIGLVATTWVVSTIDIIGACAEAVNIWVKLINDIWF